VAGTDGSPDNVYSTVEGGGGVFTASMERCGTSSGRDPITGLDATEPRCVVKGTFRLDLRNSLGASQSITDGTFRLSTQRQ
jgi:hypothetical protein